jgi:hypothetical protein
MVVGVDVEDVREAQLRLEVDEAGKRRVVGEDHLQVDDAVGDVEDAAPLHAAAHRHDAAVLPHVVADDLHGASPVDAGDPDLHHGVGGRPPVDQGVAAGGPGDATLKDVGDRLRHVRRDEGDPQQARRVVDQDPRDVVNAEAHVVEEEEVPLPGGIVLVDGPQVDEDVVGVELRDAVQDRAGRRALRLVGAARAPAVPPNSSSVGVGEAPGPGLGEGGDAGQNGGRRANRALGPSTQARGGR